VAPSSSRAFSSIPDAVIVGTGLSGLVAGRILHNAGLDVELLDTRTRVGGRCLTASVGPNNVACDLGAAWHWEEHSRVAQLAEHLGLERVRQYEPGPEGPEGPEAIRETDAQGPVERVPWPETPPPSWRIVEGMQTIHERLADTLPDDAFRFDHRVVSLRRTDAHLGVVAETPSGRVTVLTSTVILALPLRIASRIVYAPPLADSVMDLLASRPAWMSHSAKVAVTYNRPFWRERGLAGRVKSTAGPVHDWHDNTTPDGDAALVGFMHPPGPGSPTPTDAEARRDRVIRQLIHCFGEEADGITGYAEHDWTRDRATTPPSGSESDPDEEPQPVPALQKPQWDGRLHFAAAETADEHPGFLDGAIEAGTRAATAVENRLVRRGMG
jgi:monoamine oxidase